MVGLPEIIAPASSGVVTPMRASQQPLAVINRALAAATEPLAVLDRAKRDDCRFTYLGCERGIESKFLDRATYTRRAMLPAVVEVKAAHDAVYPIVAPVIGSDAIGQGLALKWLSVLFGALGKKSDENAATKLAACADMFDSAGDAIGQATRLWKPLPKHPVILALTIKRLIATSVFSPAPVELRQELRHVHERLEGLVAAAQMWLDVFLVSERIVFEFDRAEWVRTPAILQDIAAAKVFDYPGDKAGVICDARYEAQHDAALGEIEQSKPPPVRLAACSMPSPVKRTRAKKER